MLISSAALHRPALLVEVKMFSLERRLSERDVRVGMGIKVIKLAAASNQSKQLHYCVIVSVM